MERTILSLDFYGKELVAILSAWDEQQESLRILNAKYKKTNAFSSSFVHNLTTARKELSDVFTAMTRDVEVTNIDILVGLRGNFLSFKHSQGFSQNTSAFTIGPDEIRAALQDSIPNSLSESVEELDTLPISYSIDGQASSKEIPLGLFCWSLAADTFLSFATKTHLHNLSNVFATFNQPYQFLPSIVAMGETLLLAEEKNVNTLLLDVTACGTSAIMYTKGQPMDAEELTVGSDLIYQWVADMIQDDIQTAKSIVDSHERGSDEIIDELLEDAEYKLFEKIHKELLNQSFWYGKHRPTRIVLAGQLANKYSQKACKKILNPKRVRIVTCDETLEGNTEISNAKIAGALSILKHTLKQEKIATLLNPKPIENKSFWSKIATKLGLANLLS